MSILDKLKEYSLVEGKHNSLYTYMLYDYSLQTWIDELYKQLKKVNSISNKFKKLVLNKRIFSLITYLKDNRKKLGETVNTICLVGKDVFYYKLKNDEIEILKKYNIRHDLSYHDDYYHIEELIDILSNFNFDDIIELNNSKMCYRQINKYKSFVLLEKKIKNMNEIEEIIDKSDKPFGIIYGKSSFLKKFKNNKWDVCNKILTRDELLLLFKKNKIGQNNSKLDYIYELIEKADKKLIFGKDDLEQEISNYTVKELYCCTKYLNMISKLCSKECYNFPIIEVDKIEDGDNADTLEKSYDGYIGVKYY